jgi:hypothetical protein
MAGGGLTDVSPEGAWSFHSDYNIDEKMREQKNIAEHY